MSEESEIKSHTEVEATKLAASMCREARKHPDKFIVCISGGRKYSNRAKLFEALSSLHSRKSITALVEGEAMGADTLGKEWAIENEVPVIPFPAEWTNRGKRAGFVRNLFMLSFGNPDLVVVFPGGRGTMHMLIESKKKGYKVWLPYRESTYKSFWLGIFRQTHQLGKNIGPKEFEHIRYL